MTDTAPAGSSTQAGTPGWRLAASLLFLLGALFLAGFLAGCQTTSSTAPTGAATVSVEEAKKVSSAFAGSAFVPPPRTILDVTALLDGASAGDPRAREAARARADEPPPAGAQGVALAEFLHRRGLAAREIGRAQQERDDLRQARALTDATSGGTLAFEIRRDLTATEWDVGNASEALRLQEEAIELVPPDRGFIRGWLRCRLARMHADAGDLKRAREALAACERAQAQSASMSRLTAARGAMLAAAVALTQGRLAWVQGKLEEAEAAYRRALAAVAPGAQAGDAEQARELYLQQAQLSGVLRDQRRLPEAENEARAALSGMLRIAGRDTPSTAFVVRRLAATIDAQGRAQDAEALFRAAVQIYERGGLDQTSFHLAETRRELGNTVAAQGRWPEAVTVFEGLRQSLGTEFRAYQASKSAWVARDLGWALALIKVGRPDEALALMVPALERSRTMLGEAHPTTARIRGLVAMARTSRGEREEGLRQFGAAARVLTEASVDQHDEDGSGAPDQLHTQILEAYMDLLVEIRGTALDRSAGLDAAAEAFRVAEAARGQSVQRALSAASARAAARDPRLADLARREQDAQKQIVALEAVLANALSSPPDQQDAATVATLREQIEALRRARRALLGQIVKDFPDYPQLVRPTPPTVDEARRALRPDEAWVVTYVAERRVLVWAIPPVGPVAFTAATLGRVEMQAEVAELRKALEPRASVLGEIPAFDVKRAWSLYRAVLEPVRSGWGSSRSLLVVAHDPLGQLPFALLPTGPAQVPPDTTLLFAEYRQVPWLIRTHAVTHLPSVASLRALRGLPAGNPGRRPFIGFGDPIFSAEQATEATRRSRQTAATEGGDIATSATNPAGVTSPLASRGQPVTLRSAPQTRTRSSSQLAMLPALPDTADEITAMARAMGADPARDLLLGVSANEHVLKTRDLTGYRVVAFATHGLVAGDLDGLTQPALALTSPEVAGVAGDGLLTMEEILALRLNADWVVLSACNTASADGAGAEAISGLGRAFFYAGGRSLLVSGWPVETTAARTLITEIFRRQQAAPTLARAQALQQTMVWMIDTRPLVEARSGREVASYAHPLFWAPFILAGDGAADGK